jgi:threonine dehydratase
MLEHSNPARVAACEELGAEVIRVADVHLAFDRVREIEAAEGRAFIHPFEGYGVTLGTGMVGLEMVEQWPEMDMLIVPVGGGGLIAGISNAVKQLKPDCEIIGVEPAGANTMSKSFNSGKPESIDAVKTIADSLGAPFALPMSFETARQNVDRMVTVEDSEIASAMGFLFRNMNIAVEPACAAATAALLGPLRSSAAGRKVMLTFCGSNIDWKTWQSLAVFDE